MKDEGPFILEWIAFHRCIGISDILVITNDCTDGTDLILDRLDQMGMVRHLPNPTMLGRFDAPIQHIAIEFAQLTKEFRSSDWVLIMDADEFLNINIGNGTVFELLNASNGADAVSLNQVVFGSSGKIDFQDEPTLFQFKKRFRFEQPVSKNFPRMYGIKTIAKNDPSLFKRHANHRPVPKVSRRKNLRWIDGSGANMSSDFLANLPRGYRSENGTHALGYINHYAVRSVESFIVQSFRGDAVNSAIRRDFYYWQKYNRNDVIDTSIEQKAVKAQILCEELLLDGKLKALHDRAVQMHRARFQSCIKSHDLRELYDRIISSME